MALRGFEETVLPHLDAAFNYARWLTRGPAEAEDVVQDTFLKVQLSLTSLRQGTSVEAWVFTIARNETLNVIRRKQGYSGVDPENLPDLTDPHDILESKETACVVHAALNKLKTEYREVIALREFEDLSYADIAGVTGTSPDVVKMRLFRARKALLKVVKRSLDEENSHGV